jgi:phosphoribosylanthranilate isomerase
MVKVKICGITNLRDALISVEAGCDALGFLFYKKSPRYIAPLAAKKIIKSLPRKVTKIGVFVNSQEKSIKNIAKACSLDILQFHGNESAEFCRKFKRYKVIKAFRIKNKIDSAKVCKYKTFAYLFDTFSQSKFGGTGKAFNWCLLRNIKKPIFLSGGLNAGNVNKAIQAAHPVWVDASSSLEAAPGKKDPKKVREFIQSAKKGSKN